MKAGSLRRRQNGRWQYRASYGSHADGTPRYKSATFGPANPAAWSLKRAQREADTVRHQWNAEADLAADTKGTVAELVDEWSAFRAKRDSPTTTYRNRAIIARIKADLGHIKLANLTTRDLDRWYDSLLGTGPVKRPIGANTVRLYHRVMRAMLEQGETWSMVDRNVAKKASPPEVVKADQSARMPTLAAVVVMLGKANRSVRMAVMLSALTGARRGEVVGLRWSDIDGERLWVRRSLIHVAGSPVAAKSTKTGRDRSVPLPPSLLAELVAYRASGEQFASDAGRTLAADGPILAHLRTDPTGRAPFSPEWFSQEWERLCKRSAVAPFKLHGLRHLHVSQLHDAGATSAAIAGRVGHAAISTTEGHYMHALPAAEIALAQTVEDVFGPLFRA